MQTYRASGQALGVRRRCALFKNSYPLWLPRRIDVATLLRARDANNTQSSGTLDSPNSTTAVAETVPSVSQSPSSVDDYDDSSFRFLPSQLPVFSGLANSMQNCSWALMALAIGNVVVNALEAAESPHHLAEQGAQAAAVAEQAAAAPAVAEAASSWGASSILFLEELVRAISLNDVAFCANEVIPALLIMYAMEPFAQLSKNPDEPQMALALQGVGRLSLTMQQLAWTSGSVGVVRLLLSATEYPPIVGVASGVCLVVALARGGSLWWVLSKHTTSGEEVARTLAALRGGANAAQMDPLDRVASWLALGVLLQAEPRAHGKDGGHKKKHEEESSAASAAAAVKPHYEFGVEEERVLRSLVEGANAAGLAIALLVLSTLALGLAEAASGDSGGWVSHIVLSAQKTANALALFASAAAFDKALHNEDGNDDTDHLLEGLGSEHSGMTGLFNSITVLSLALLLAAGVGLLIPSLEESPLGALLGDGFVHASADMLVEVLEML